ncbi:hypothetical protein HN51_047838 [Arachis hypogaea]
MLHEKIHRCDLKSHPNANGLYNKPFSHFEELGIAFGRDRAQGGNAENVTQAVATMEAEREATLSDRQVNENTQHEKEGIERRIKLMALLRDVLGLSVDDRMKASLSIIRDNSLIDMVFQLQLEELLPLLKKLI